MVNKIRTSILLVFVLLLNATTNAQENNNQNSQSKTEKNMKQVLIDKLTLPATSREEFIQRMNMNREIIKQQPGFVKDEVFERTDENGNLIFITIATWESAEAIKNAKQSVDAAYKRSNFNMIEFSQKLNIRIERGIYQPFSN